MIKTICNGDGRIKIHQIGKTTVNRTEETANRWLKIEAVVSRYVMIGINVLISEW